MANAGIIIAKGNNVAMPWTQSSMFCFQMKENKECLWCSGSPPDVSTALLLHFNVNPSTLLPLNRTSLRTVLEPAVSSHHSAQICSPPTLTVKWKKLQWSIVSKSEDATFFFVRPRFNKNHNHPCAGGQQRGLLAVKRPDRPERESWSCSQRRLSDLLQTM